MEKVFKKVELKVNGKEITLNPFANNIIGNTIWGMVSSLKLDDEPEKIEIKILLKP
ncbi:MAG: hypothetical protein OEV55_00705 [candidate division Zixibacteria bacterium]|nr:hypothetical protein [candidate division Zixibacteria bacterium]